MKRNWNIFSWGRKKEEATHKAHKREVVDATQKTLRRYSKTYKDLARYDRGERQPTHSVPR